MSSKKLILFVLSVSLLTSCASKKAFEAQQSRINSLEESLNKQLITQSVMARDQRILRDSVQMLLPLFKQQQIEFEYKTYKTAVGSGDRQLAAQSLSRILLLDSTQAYWVCDSLSLYHYLYLMTPGVPRQSQTALYYTLKGLKVNPDNIFLKEMYAKLNLELQNDSIAYQTFRSLWSNYGDYTYLWEMTFMDLYVFQNMKQTEATISRVIGSKESMVKLVRVEQTEERRIDEIPARAAFLYLRASIQGSKGQLSAARKTLEEVVKLAPGFMSAQRALYQMQNQRY